MNTINRLQFRHHNEIFEDRCKAIEYIYDSIKENGEGLASEQNSPYGYSLFAEPTILRYKNEDDEVHDCKGDETCQFKKGPHLMLVIGSETNDTIYHDRNRFCVIDIDKTEDEIKNLEEELAAAVKSLTLAVFNTSTLDLHVEKTEDGTFLSGDVKIAETHVFDGIVKENNLMVVPFDDEAGPEGLFIYIDLTYDEPNETFTFVVTNADGTLKTQSVKLPNNYLVSGEYNKEDESLHLHMKNGDEVVVDCEELIAEWGVEGDASKTPIVLTREEIDYDGTDEHHHVEPWQDVLRADIRVATDRKHNILDRTSDGRYLYVDGVASNIAYYWNGNQSDVKEQLDNLNQIRISQHNENIIWNRADGWFASTKLDYITSENKLVFTTSNVSGNMVVKEIPLNTVEIIESITYDPVNERLVIKYKNDKGETETVYVPISGMIDEWDVLNDAHSVKLVKQRNVSGKDILTADVNISTTVENNILEERGEGNLHTLFVKGTADNIKYGRGTVQSAIDGLIAEDESINARIDNEISRAISIETALDEKIDAEEARAKGEELRIDNTIGSGFSTDTHETVTYRFNELDNKVDAEINRATNAETALDEKIDAETARATSAETSLNEKIDNEISRSINKDNEHDNEIETINSTIGDGFSTDAHETVTYKFNELQNQVNSEAAKLQGEIDRSTAKDSEHDGRLNVIDSEIDAISADTLASLKDVINNDNSINVDRTNPVKPVVKVNLSNHEPYNTIRLEGDGLYNFIDLDYNPTSNKLTLTRSDKDSMQNQTKEIQLNSVSFIDDITYDPETESIVITYHSGEVEKRVEINLGQIFQEWEVYNDPNSAVKLNRERVIDGKDKLSAEVIITTAHTDNILENVHGALYVSNSGITANTAAIESLDGRMDTAESDIDALENNLREETSARTLADEALGARIDQEIEDRINDVDAEQSRAEAAELALSNKIDADVLAEKNRAINAETVLNTAIADETTRATTAEENLSHLLDDEISARINADTALGDRIDNEEARAREIETRLDTRLESEIARAQSAEGDLNTAITNETLRAQAADNELYQKIADEASDRQTADAALENLISIETSRAQNAEDSLAHDILTEKNRALSEEARIETKLDNEISRSITKDNELSDAISNEVSRSTSAETSLNSKIDAETSRATIVEANIQEALTNEVTRAMSAETALETAIADETTRATNTETNIQNALNSEISRSTAKDSELTTAINDEKTRAEAAELILRNDITAETIRANNADAELSREISDEAIARVQADAALELKLTAETASREASEAVIESNLQSEITRSTEEDQRLTNAIQQEVTNRQQGDAELAQRILDATLTFDDTVSIDFTKSTGNVVTADVKLQEGDNIIKAGSGLYASVHLSYDPGTNKIRLVTSNGADEEIQLVGASLLEDLHYDSTNKALVITYKDATGQDHTVQFGVSELFNEWSVNNPSENSAIELTKTTASEPGGEDKISGRVLLTNLEDNAVQIVNNGLYVSNSAMTEAYDIAQCAKNELKVVEQVVIGHAIAQECGSGYTYEPNVMAKYINTATSFNNADFILDQNLKNVEEKTDEAIDDISCLTNEVKVFEKAVLGNSISEECGSGFTYTPNQQTTYINSATSFDNADVILDQNLKRVETDAERISAKTDCVASEIKVFEKAVLGNSISEECGNGYTYNPNQQATYINSATSFDNADFILDQNIGRLETDINIVSGNVKCTDDKANKIYELLYGVGQTMPQCGEGAAYQPYVGACIISGATSFNEADQMLNDQICQILTMWVSGETCTTKSEWVEDGSNRKIVVNTKVSRGSTGTMSDDEIVIENITGDYIDPTSTEFTDTNALRIVCLQEGPSGTTPSVTSLQNGLYLSNVWDCGLYYGTTVEDQDAKAAAEAAGYKTDYSTDENSSASGYNYMNNVR